MCVIGVGQTVLSNPAGPLPLINRHPHARTTHMRAIKSATSPRCLAKASQRQAMHHRRSFPCPSVPPRAAAQSRLGPSGRTRRTGCRPGGLPAGPAGRAAGRTCRTGCRAGCRPRHVQLIFSVYNFMDEKPAQCTIRRQNRTFGRFFVRKIVHIEDFMPVGEA